MSQDFLVIQASTGQHCKIDAAIFGNLYREFQIPLGQNYQICLHVKQPINKTTKYGLHDSALEDIVVQNSQDLNDQEKVFPDDVPSVTLQRQVTIQPRKSNTLGKPLTRQSSGDLQSSSKQLELGEEAQGIINPFEEDIDEEGYKKFLVKKAKDEKLEKQIKTNAIELRALGIENSNQNQNEQAKEGVREGPQQEVGELEMSLEGIGKPEEPADSEQKEEEKAESTVRDRSQPEAHNQPNFQQILADGIKRRFKKTSLLDRQFQKETLIEENELNFRNLFEGEVKPIDEVLPDDQMTADEILEQMQFEEAQENYYNNNHQRDAKATQDDEWLGLQLAEYKGELWDDSSKGRNNKQALDDRVKDLVRYYNSLEPQQQPHEPRHRVLDQPQYINTEISQISDREQRQLTMQSEMVEAATAMAEKKKSDMTQQYEKLRHDYNSLLSHFDQSQELRKIYQHLINEQTKEMEEIKGQLALKQRQSRYDFSLVEDQTGKKESKL